MTMSDKPVSLVNKESAKFLSKLELLARKDSGYISPITPASQATSTDGTVIRRSLSAAQTHTASSSSGETSPEPAHSPVEVGLTLTADASQDLVEMQRTVVSSSQSSYSGEAEATSPEFAHLQGTQHSHHGNLNDDKVLLAFQCRSNHPNWDSCYHPYCYKVRSQWYRFKRCCADILQPCCPDCQKFKAMILNHSSSCTNQTCPVVMCTETKNFTHAQKQATPPEKRPLHRSQSFHERTPVTEYAGLQYLLSSDYQYTSLGNNGYASLGASNHEEISLRAQEIVDRLDKEKPLLPSTSQVRPQSLPQQEGEVVNVLDKKLSPIEEIPGGEILSSPTSSDNYTSLMIYNGPPSLITRNQFMSMGSVAYSSLGDGTGDSSNSFPSQTTSQPTSMLLEQQAQEVARVYPTQQLLHKLDNLYLTPGQDGFYYQDRDYYINDVDTLGSGGFGTCMWGKDNQTELQFAMKRNKEYSEDKIDSMRAECFVLSRLKPHDNVIRFLGAVIDEEDNNILLPRVFKMFMELADCGNLAEMLIVDHDNKILEALPLDQSLYYIEQVLQGVNYLHQNGVLHLDIKAVNVLVFEGGRTVKLADFGTAIQKTEIAAVGGKMNGVTPYFASPEVVRQEIPTFSADIWSVMCVLVELLTTKWPGCHTQPATHQQMIFMVGQYQDCDIEKLVPLSQMDLDPEIAKLFRCVFVADPSERPSAMTLLNHPLIREAPEYASEFDYVDQEYMEQEVPVHQSMLQETQSYIEQAPPISIITPSLGTSSYMPSHYHYSPAQPMIESASSQPHSITASQQQPHSCVHETSYPTPDLECDFGRCKRESCDSGRGEELEASFSSCPRRCSTTSSFLYDHRYSSDSGIETPASASYHRKFSQWSDSTFPTFDNREDYHSYPFGNHFKHSVLDPHKAIPTPHRLYHSFSAPIVGEHSSRRRLSLQISMEQGTSDGGRPRLRRTSSMVYVDKGPEIDSPEREKRASIEELISDVSNLNLSSPSHSRQPRTTTPSTEHVQNGGHVERTVKSAVSSTVTTHVPVISNNHTNETIPSAALKTMTVLETLC